RMSYVESRNSNAPSGVVPLVAGSRLRWCVRRRTSALGVAPGGRVGRTARSPPARSRLAPGKECQELVSGWRSRDTEGLQPAGQPPFLDLSESVFAGFQVAVPGLLVPDLHPVAGPDHHDIAVQTGVLAQMAGDGHPALLVRHLVVGAGEEDPAVGPGRLVGHG